MKVTVVGFWGAYPEENEATSSYLIEKDGFKLLLDCGSGALSQLPKYVEPYDLDAVILTHYHNDHIADIGVLQYHMLVQNGIRQQEKVLPIYGHTFDQDHFAGLTHNFTKGYAYDPIAPLELGPFTISFFETDHPVTCFAMRISDGESNFVFTADSSYKEGFISFSDDADLLITDCNFYEGQDGSKAGHMNSKECATIAERAGVKQLVLSHHPHFGDRSKLASEAEKYFRGNIQLAQSGLTFHLG